MNLWKPIDPRIDGATFNEFMVQGAHRVTGFESKSHSPRDLSHGILGEIFVASIVT